MLGRILEILHTPLIQTITVPLTKQANGSTRIMRLNSQISDSVEHRLQNST